MIVLPPMLAAQTASWHALLDVYEKHPEGWTLVGGQMVHLHCAERDHSPTRPTNDADAVLDVRSDPHFLRTFTATLMDLGFTYQTSGEGLQHRWVRGDAQIDVLLPTAWGNGRRRVLAPEAAPLSRPPAAPRHSTGPRPSRSPSKDAKATSVAPTSSERWS